MEKEQLKEATALEEREPIKIEAADEWKSSSEFFNYHATLDPDSGFVTIKFNFRGDLAIPPVFDAVMTELRKIVIRRNEAMDTEAEFMPPSEKNGPGFLCVAFYEFKGGLMIGSREHILKNKVPEAVYQLLLDAVPTS